MTRPKVYVLVSILLALLCCKEIIAQKQIYVPNGGTFTPKGQLNVLVVYAGFTNDNDPKAPLYNDENWPSSEQFPKYSEEIFYSDPSKFSDTATDKSLSNFFYQMSRDSEDPLKIVGHKLPIRIDVQATNKGNAKGWGYYFRKVFNKLDSLPNIDWQKFDQRKNNPNYRFDNSKTGPDGMLDFVIVVFRFNGNPPYGTTTRFRNGWGASTLFATADLKNNGPHSFVDDVIHIRTGFSIARGINGVSGIRGFFLHENAHEMYEMPHVFGTNGAVGNKFNVTNGWGMMGINKMLYCANAWERWLLGWIDIKYDLKNAKDNGEYILGDYLTTGDAIRIEIPETDGKQHLWIENHQGKSVFDERDDWNGKRFPEKPRDLLMFIESMPSTRLKTPGVNDMDHVNGIRTLCASGNFDYTYEDNFTKTWLVGDNPIFDFKVGAENPLAGYSDISEIRLDYMKKDFRKDPKRKALKDGIIWTRHNHGNELGCTPCKSERVYNFKQNGKLNMGFLGKNAGFVSGDKLNLSSNPMITNTPKYYQRPDSITPYFLNGLQIEVLEKLDDGSIKIKVEFDHFTIDTSTRYAGNIELKNINKTESDIDLIVANKSTLLVNKSGVANQRVERGEGTGDHVRPSLFTIGYMAKMQIDARSKMVLSEGSRLRLKQGSVLELNPKSRLEITDSCQIKLDQDAKILVSKKARIKGLKTGKHLYKLSKSEKKACSFSKYKHVWMRAKSATRE